jgi:hypothetical protein
MKPLIPFLFIVQTALVALAGLSVANADVLAGLPIHGTTDNPALLLELGSAPPSAGVDDKTTRVFTGEVYAHEGDASIQTDKDEISSLHPGFGSWKISFRFNVKPGFPPSLIPFGRAGDRVEIPMSACNLSKSGPDLIHPGWSCALHCP